jgi:excisionase family DNA binding protein
MRAQRAIRVDSAPTVTTARRWRAMSTKDTVAMMTAAEVATRLGVSRHAVYRAASDGRLPCRRWSRKLVFLVSELNEHFESLPKRATTKPRDE